MGKAEQLLPCIYADGDKRREGGDIFRQGEEDHFGPERPGFYDKRRDGRKNFTIKGECEMSSYIPEIYIKEKNGVVVTTSLDVAEKFGKGHDYVLKSIRKISLVKKDEPEPTVISEFTLRNFAQSSYLDDRGKRQPMFYITRAGFSILAMGFTGKKALEWKIKYESTFSLMETTILNTKNLLWQQDRQSGKLARRAETDTVKDFVEYAISQGSTQAPRYYGLITTATYKALFLIQDKFPGSFRDMLDGAQLLFLGTAEHLAQRAIAEGMAKGLFYKDVFQLAKRRLETLGSAVGITPVINHSSRNTMEIAA
jgi:Rha family phage regulatory protein